MIFLCLIVVNFDVMTVESEKHTYSIEVSGLNSHVGPLRIGNFTFTIEDHFEG